MIASGPSVIHGIDFSGAQDAGNLIWISSAAIENGRLRIMDCRPASELIGGNRKRDAALVALRDFIRAQSGSTIGLDFPFGLPRSIVPEPTWREFVLAFNKRYTSADAFRSACQTASGRELRRTTDKEAKTPWSPWNWRLYRQTYYGIACVLAPLVSNDGIRVLPMEAADKDRPWVLEICPASTLRHLGLIGLRYKEAPGIDSSVARVARKRILDRLVGDGNVLIDPAPLERALQDGRGDGLDGMVAARSTFEAVSSGRLFPAGSDYQIEGYVYC